MTTLATLAAAGLLLGTLSLLGCATATCEQECEEDDDCESGLSCFHGESGRMCAPAACDACSAGCTYLKREDSADDVECRFQSCF